MGALEEFSVPITLGSIEELPVCCLMPASKLLAGFGNRGLPGERSNGSRPASRARRSLRPQRRMIGRQWSGVVTGTDWGPGARA